MKTRILLITVAALALVTGDAMARGGGGGGGGGGWGGGSWGSMRSSFPQRTTYPRRTTPSTSGDRTQDRVHQDSTTQDQDRTQDRLHQDATQDRTQDRLRTDQDTATPDGQAARQGNGYSTTTDSSAVNAASYTDTLNARGASQGGSGDQTQDRLRTDQDTATPDGQAARQGNGYSTSSDSSAVNAASYSSMAGDRSGSQTATQAQQSQGAAYGYQMRQTEQNKIMLQNSGAATQNQVMTTESTKTEAQNQP